MTTVTQHSQTDLGLLRSAGVLGLALTMTAGVVTVLATFVGSWG